MFFLNHHKNKGLALSLSKGFIWSVNSRDLCNTRSLSASRLSTAGFTLIEFVVIISIFAIIATIVLFNFSGFSSNISLSNLSHDVALVLREAQVSAGSSVTGGSIDLFNDSPNARGVFFEEDNGSYSSDMIIFEDIDDDGIYDIGEEIDTITIQSTDYISSIETGMDEQSANECQGDVYITFVRPDPSPVVNCSSNNQLETFANIEISSSDGVRHKNIHIYSTGQINVQ